MDFPGDERSGYISNLPLTERVVSGSRHLLCVRRENGQGARSETTSQNEDLLNLVCAGEA
jgi:hypothetical protein